MTKLRPRPACALGCLALLLVGAAVPLVALLWHPVTSGKYEPVEAGPGPSASPGQIVAEHQDEPHTCGLHALRAIYRAYGLDPAARRLRFRLGVDRPGVPFDEQSLGSLHPDVFRVAAQDGLTVQAAGPDDDVALRAHLEAGHPALLLVRTRASGALHWVVVDAVIGEALRVHDSLAAEPYLEPAPAWLGSHVLSVLLIRPGEPSAGSAAAHAAGLIEMQRVARRLEALPARSE